MRKLLFGSSAAIMLAAALFALPWGVSAQVAPTNSATITGSVNDPAGRPIAGAAVVLTGLKNASTETDGHGQFLFIGVPFGTYQISATSTQFGRAVRSLSVQGDINVAIAYGSTNTLKTIASVHSSSVHFNVTPASVTQLNPAQLALQGETNWGKILEKIPGISVAGSEGGVTPSSAIPDSPLAPVQVSINGAPPYESGTLFDEMPLNGGGGLVPGSGLNMSTIALNGVNSVDVIRGPGANTASIVNSIGGSLDMHPPGFVTQNTTDISASNDAYGGIVTQFRSAMHFQKLSVVLAYGVDVSPGPNSHAGFPGVITTAPVTVDGKYFGTGTYFVGYSGALVAPGYSPYSVGSQYGFTSSLQMCCFNTTTAWSQHSGSLALTYAVSPTVTAEFYYTGQRSQGNVNGGYDEDVFDPPAGYAGSLQPGVHYFFNNVTNVNPPTYVQAANILEEKVTAQIGRGTLKVAFLQNKDYSTQSASAPAGGTYQIYGQGYYCSSVVVYSIFCGTSANPGTPHVFNGGTYSVTWPQYNFLFDGRVINRDELISFATPLGNAVRAGVSYVQSGYNEPCFNYQDVGVEDISVTNITPDSISETTGEFRAFIGMNPSEKTSVDLSGYFVRSTYHIPGLSGYDDLGFSYATPRLGFVWHPQSAIAIRLAAGGGFSQPTLLSYGSALIEDYGTQYFQLLPNPNLRPETSFGEDLGADIRLHHNTMLSVDLFNANLYNQTYQDCFFDGTYTGASGTLPLETRTYLNLAHSRYQSIIADLRHDVPKGVYWSFAGGFTRGYVVSVPTRFYNAPGLVCDFKATSGCQNLNVVPGPNFNGSISVGGGGGNSSVPYSQALATIGYRWSPQKFVDITGTYYGPNNSYLVPAFAEFDGHVGYPINSRISLLLSFRNITGIYDSPVQTVSAARLTSAPVISGLPYALVQEPYGPRTVILTTQLHF